jgi:hypothetical protein
MCEKVAAYKRPQNVQGYWLIYSPWTTSFKAGMIMLGSDCPLRALWELAVGKFLVASIGA